MAEELLGVSKFKLHLLALISEARDLRDSERCAREELLHSAQRGKQIEAECARKVKGLQMEVASRDEVILKLESKVKFLKTESALLGKREKDLKEMINDLLQSRDTFLSVYQESTSELRHSIEKRDKMLAVLSEKIQAHMLVLDSIRKEAASVKHVVDNIKHLVIEKEQVATVLKLKMEKISEFEKDFVDKIHFLEDKLSEYKLELRRREITIFELKEHLAAEKIGSNLHSRVEELQRTLLVKEELIQRLTSEKQALHLELQNLQVILQRIQCSFIKMSVEDQKALSLAIENPEACEIIDMKKNESSENIILEITKANDSGSGSTEHSDHQEQKVENIENELPSEKKFISPCINKPSVCFSPQSARCDYPLPTNAENSSSEGHIPPC
ncbi:Ribosomal protein L4 domain-containing protein [Dioscorea alata]|uniref:Ribosomal protein L4 domain-containing protein n=2 Tax=Dioscorea alata TaxID=55571 RepID=A0ACB7UZA0_DIOAL|nr:Ribosomal protein L4 domain-containing protein [Dioscorea alata]KAH7666150.1 Ribosomal protein L4 domain-containing protein [Dioscorea alata]